mgnify:CR=1 FL=1
MADINMRSEFEKLAAQGKIAHKQVETLVQLTTHGCCLHKFWGFGRITTVDTVFARFTIDFKDRPGHQMDLSFAADTLKPIPADHILARKALNLNELRQIAAGRHLDLVKMVLNSYGGQATVDQIHQLLVPDVIQSDWKKWWEGVRAEMKKDGHFIIPTKKTEPIVYQGTVVSVDELLLKDFRSARGLKARNQVAHEVLKNLGDLANREAVLNEVIGLLNADIASHQRTQPATALEAVFMRDELRAAAGLPAPEGEITEKSIWAQPEVTLASVLVNTTTARQRRMLKSFRDAAPENWEKAVQIALNNAPAKLVAELAHLLIEEQKLEVLKETLARLINQHQASSELLLWLAKERSDSFADILGPEVFRAMLTAMERDQFNEKKSNRLGDFIVNDQELLVQLIESADIDVIKDLTRALQLSPCFDDMNKRSLLARIVKSYPAMQSLITGEQTGKQENFLLVSWESLARRRDEYHELVQKKIPANSREIAVARSYGDLRENHEYKAAKEMQKLLMRRKAELEQQLLRARGTDFSNARADAAGLGTRVRVTDLDTQQPESYAIMGAWDSDPDKSILSYLSPLAKALIGHKAGEELTFDMEGHVKRLRIESVELLEAAPAPAVSDSAGETAAPEQISAAASPAAAVSAPEAPASAPEAAA